MQKKGKRTEQAFVTELKKNTIKHFKKESLYIGMKKQN